MAVEERVLRDRAFFEFAIPKKLKIDFSDIDFLFDLVWVFWMNFLLPAAGSGPAFGSQLF